MTGTQQYKGMESGGTSVSPADKAGCVIVADRAGERETNAFGQLTAPEAAGRRETKEPCPMETVESMGARRRDLPP